MAGASLFALLDDIASILDDVAAMSKVAAKKTAGVLGDDLALNAQQVSGVKAERELPVVWAVARGSLKNKAILVPAALAISAFLPWAITPLLMLGGTYLCYEGFEKIVHPLLHRNDEEKNKEDGHRAQLAQALADPAIDLVALEQDKIKGAIRTDFILSAEIIVISLGTVAGAPFGQQVTVIVAIAIAMTVGVYGLVAGIVKLDDAGLYLSRRTGTGAARQLLRALGRALLAAAPKLMKALSLIGTVAMFMVGGGILTHGWPAAHDAIAALAQGAAAVPGIGAALQLVLPTLLDALAGVAAGALALVLVGAATRVARLFKRNGAQG
jgi:predicted DNA repair protein MutK